MQVPYTKKRSIALQWLPGVFSRACESADTLLEETGINKTSLHLRAEPIAFFCFVFDGSEDNISNIYIATGFHVAEFIFSENRLVLFFSNCIFCGNSVFVRVC